MTEKFYHIDNSKEIPSDRIVIDKIYLDLPADTSQFDLGNSPKSPRELAAVGNNVYWNKGKKLSHKSIITTQKTIILLKRKRVH